MSTPIRRRPMPLINDAAFLQSPEARREEARAALQRPTVDQIGRGLLRAAIHGDAFTVASKVVRADAPPVTREPPPDGYPVADEPAEGTGQPTASRRAVPEGHPDRIHAGRQAWGPENQPFEMRVFKDDKPLDSVEYFDNEQAAQAFADKLNAQPQWEGTGYEARVFPPGTDSGWRMSQRVAQTPDEEEQLRSLGWSDDAIGSMSAKQIETILQRQRRNPKSPGEPADLPMAASRRAQAGECGECGCPKGRHDDMGCRECDCTASYGITDDDEWEAFDKQRSQMPGVDPAQERDRPFGPQHGSRQAAPVTWVYTQDGQIGVPDEMVKPEPGDQYEALRGHSHVLAVKRGGQWVGFVSTDDLGVSSAKEWMEANPKTGRRAQQEGTPRTCKMHGDHTYDICPNDGHQFCSRYWTDCPRCGGQIKEGRRAQQNPMEPEQPAEPTPGQPGQQTGQPSGGPDGAPAPGTKLNPARTKEVWDQDGKFSREVEADGVDDLVRIHRELNDMGLTRSPDQAEQPQQAQAPQGQQPAQQPIQATSKRATWSYPTYEEAFNAAIDLANQVNMSVGLEHNKLFKEWTLGLLPPPDRRSGWELRCQVVDPGTPKSGRRARSRRTAALKWEDKGGDVWGSEAKVPIDIQGGRPITVPLRIDGRGGEFKFDTYDLAFWVDAANGKTFGSLEEAKAFAEQWLAAATEQETSSPRVGSRRAQMPDEWGNGNGNGDGEECPLCSASQPAWSPGTGTCQECGYDAEDMAGVDETVGGDPLFEEYASALEKCSGPGCGMKAQEQGDEFEWKPKRKTPSGAPPADAPVETGVGAAGPTGASRQAASVSDAIDSCEGDCSCPCHQYDGPESGLEKALDACDWPCDCPCHPAVGGYDKASRRAQDESVVGEIVPCPDCGGTGDQGDQGYDDSGKCVTCSGKGSRPEFLGESGGEKIRTLAELLAAGRSGHVTYYMLKRDTRPHAGRRAQSGYTDCPCRDCFDTSMDGQLCGLCEEAGCSAEGDQECARSDAYGAEDEVPGGGGPVDEFDASRTAQAWAETTTAPMTAQEDDEEVAYPCSSCGSPSGTQPIPGGGHLCLECSENDQQDARERLDFPVEASRGMRQLIAQTLCYETAEGLACRNCGAQMGGTKRTHDNPPEGWAHEVCPKCGHTLGDVFTGAYRTKQPGGSHEDLPIAAQKVEAPLGGPVSLDETPDGDETFGDTKEAVERLAAWYDDISDDKFKKRMKEKSNGKAKPSEDIEKDAQYIPSPEQADEAWMEGLEQDVPTQEAPPAKPPNGNGQGEPVEREMGPFGSKAQRRRERPRDEDMVLGFECHDCGKTVWGPPSMRECPECGSDNLSEPKTGPGMQDYHYSRRMAQPIGMPPAAAGVVFEKSNERSKGDRVVWDLAWEPDQFAAMSTEGIKQQVRSFVTREIGQRQATDRTSTRNWGFSADPTIEDIDVDAGIATVSFMSSEQAAPQYAPAQVTE